MKEGIHPDYREVVFADLQTGSKFITRSTVQTRETIELDGKTYPLFKCDVTSESHPFYTGAQTRIVETGRVEKFRARFAHTQARSSPLPDSVAPVREPQQRQPSGCFSPARLGRH